MDQVIAGVVSALIVAAISGMTILAFKEPRLYDFLAFRICLAGFGITALGFVWNEGVSESAVRAMRAVSQKNGGSLASVAYDAGTSAEFPLGWMVLCSCGLFFYFALLAAIPFLRRTLDAEKKDGA